MREKVRCAVLVSGGGTNLQALIDAQEAGAMPSVCLALVISNREGAYALRRAEAAGIPAALCVRGSAGAAEWEENLLSLLGEHRIDLIVLAGFLSILSDDFVRRYPYRILNVHPSLIPAFCGKGFYGLRVHEAALARGVKVTGATVHFVNEIPDGGEIILQKAVRVKENDTPESLQRRVMEEAEWILLPRATEAVAAALRKKEENA